MIRVRVARSKQVGAEPPKAAPAQAKATAPRKVDGRGKAQSILAALGGDAGGSTTALDEDGIPSKRRRTEEAPCDRGSSARSSSAVFFGTSLEQELELATKQEQVLQASGAREACDAIGATPVAECRERKGRPRATVRQKLFESLHLHMKHRPEAALSKLAYTVEKALHDAFFRSDKDYIHKARSVLFNLRDVNNQDFRSMLVVGFLSPSDVPLLSADDMASYECMVQRTRLREESMKEVLTDWDVDRSQTVTGILSCEECQGTRTTYFQLQTRSGDEPMTTYAACLQCGHRWKC